MAHAGAPGAVSTVTLVARTPAGSVPQPRWYRDQDDSTSSRGAIVYRAPLPSSHQAGLTFFHSPRAAPPQ
jgi:hypothetical protein